VTNFAAILPAVCELREKRAIVASSTVGIDDVDRTRWYVVQTKPKQEARAESNLRRWGIQTLAPKVRELRRPGRGLLSYREVALFPNYVFASFDAATLVTKVRLTRGVQRVVGFGEYATPVEESIIRMIQSRIEEDGFVRRPELRPGDRVEILDGPLQSFVGVFERNLPAHDRVTILLTTVGCHARVQVAKAAIQRTPAVA
jgi:transcriptional antiterminator RfaH